MKAIVSTTLDNKYLYFLPIVTWCWNKIGVGVINFAPNTHYSLRACLVFDTLVGSKFDYDYKQYDCHETREATYAQCARLYAAALDLPEEEVLITSDIDMAIFGEALKQKSADFDIFGFDLCPPNQYPICYISATVKNWRSAMEINGRSYQKCLDDLLGSIEGNHIRGNYWAKDQETAYQKISQHNNIHLHGRAHPGTQFSTRRLDRDDHYILDRLSPDIVDFHMPRPGYDHKNFDIIMKCLRYFYPNDDFGWLETYTEQYRKLL